MMTGKYLLALAFIALLSITDYFLIETRRAVNEAGVAVMLAVGREITLVGRIAGLSQFLVPVSYTHLTLPTILRV